MKRLWRPRPKIVEDLLGQLLANRGFLDPISIQNFLDPQFEKSYDPFLLSDMDRAVARIEEAFGRGEQITVYADYDADAVTAAAVLLRFFEKINYPKVNFYIPDRFTEGYGVNPEAVVNLRKAGTNLLITVDCGINAHVSVKEAKELGIDTIITDHHHLTGELPEAAAVVDPHRPDDSYPFKGLTGAGVAYKLVQALLSKLGGPSAGSGRASRGWEKWLLDLVAIGTVADCQSLLSENRIFVKWGLVVLEKTRWPGLKKLLETAGLFGTKLDTYKIGFMIAPRLNAAGRIEHANLALRLLLTDDVTEAEELAQKLNELNRYRQELTSQILSEAREQLLQAANLKILLAAGKGWPKGIVGLVAGKLTEEFSRPVLVLEQGEIEATGSARSVRNFNIIEAISQNREFLLKFGGHPMAAGFTLKTEHIELFHQNLLTYAENNLDEQDLEPVIDYEAEISLNEITPDLLGLLERFTPFGLGNPRPIFRLNKLTPRFVSPIGEEGKHLRFYVEENGQLFNCVGFNLGFWAEKLGEKRSIDALCEPQYNEWNGEKKIQLKLLDLKYSDENQD